MKNLYTQLQGHFKDKYDVEDKEAEKILKSFLREKVNPIFHYGTTNTLYKTFKDLPVKEGPKKKEEMADTFKDLPTKENPKKDKKKTNNNNYYKWITIFHFLFGIPLEAFELPEKNILQKTIESLQKNDGEMETELYRLYELKELETSPSGGENKADQCYEGCTEFLDYLGTNPIYVYDYLDRFSDEIEEYTNLHDDIFNEIEKRIDPDNKGKPQFEYARFLALPLDVSKHYMRLRRIGSNLEDEIEKLDNYPEKLRNVIEALKDEYKQLDNLPRAIIDHCSVPLFKHICRCLKKFSDYFEKEDEFEKRKKISNYGGFYMVRYPTRTYHYAYINNGNFCLTEYYRYNYFTQCKPLLLFIEQKKKKAGKKKGALSDLAANYKDEIDKLFSQKKIEKPRLKKLKLKDIEAVIKQYKKENQKLNLKLHKDRIIKQKMDFFDDLQNGLISI